MERSGKGHCSNHMMHWAANYYGRCPSKGTLSNQFGKGVREKSNARQKRNRATKFSAMISHQLGFFRSRNITKGQDSIPTIRQGTRACFKHSLGKRIHRNWGSMFTSAETIEYLTETQNYNSETNTIEDYYSNEVFNVLDTKFHLDHIDPQGGNTLENLAVTQSIYNQMKTYCTPKQFYDNMEKVLRAQRPHLFK